MNVPRSDLPPEPETLTAPLYAWSELGLAERLVHYHGRDLRYCHALGTWLVWDGTKWSPDVGPLLQQRVVDVVRAIPDAEGWACETDEAADKLAAWARKCETVRVMGNAGKLASNMLPVDEDELDQHHDLLPVQNGVIDLRTGELLPHDRARFNTISLPTHYDPDAEAPTWGQFLEWFVCGEWPLWDYLHKLFGYWLTGRVSSQQITFFIGGGANGKSTLLDTLTGLLGEYGTSAPPTLLVDVSRDQHPAELMVLRGRRLVVASETKDSRHMDEEKVKRLTGDDAIRARFMRQNWVEFAPTHKLAIGLNVLPVVTGRDYGIKRRLHVVPCRATIDIAAGEADPHLKQKLREEYPGILAWAVQGAVKWYAEGLQPGGSMLEVAKAWLDESDTIGVFLDECVEAHADGELTCAQLYAAYSEWTRAMGHRPLSSQKLGRKLRERGFIDTRTRSRRGWAGVVLRQDWRDALGGSR